MWDNNSSVPEGLVVGDCSLAPINHTDRAQQRARVQETHTHKNQRDNLMPSSRNQNPSFVISE